MKATTPRLQMLGQLEQRWLIPLILVAGILTAIRAILLATQGATTLSDDAYYYLIPARNSWHLGFYSFDGQNATNGFHPLWMFLVRLLVGAMGTDAPDRTQTVGLIGLQAVLYLGTVVLVCAAIKRLRAGENQAWLYFAGLALILVYPYTAGLFFNGMETTLATLFFVLLIWSVVESRLWLFAIAAPLLFLSRLDTLVFVIFPCAIYLLFQLKDLRSRAIAVAPLLITVAAYLGLNYSAFGHPMPISGMLKSSFPRVHFNPTHLIDSLVFAQQSGGAYHKLLLIPANLSTLAAAILAALAITLAAKRFRGLAAVSLWMGGLLILNIVVFQKWDKQVEGWYLVLPTVTCLPALFYALATGKRGTWTWQVVALAIVALSVPLLGYSLAKESLTAAKASKTEGGLNAPLWYDDDVLTALGVPKDAVLAGTDVGTASFRSHRRIVNLDGLINNFEYQDALRSGRLREYLRKNGVSYLIATVWRTPPSWELRPNDKMYVPRVNPEAVEGGPYRIPFRIYSYLYDTYSEPIELTPEMEVYRTPVTRDGLIDARDILFDLRR